MEQLKIGVYVCDCGVNIAGTVNVPEVVQFAQGLPNVAVAREYKYTCSEPGQKMIQDDIRNLGINRVVVASCSPAHARADLPERRREGRAEPLLLAHGQHPRARLVGGQGQRPGDGEGQAPGERRPCSASRCRSR